MADFEDIHGNTLTRLDHRYERLTGDTDLDYAAWVADRLDRETLPPPARITGPPIPFEVLERVRTMSGRPPTASADVARNEADDGSALLDWPPIAHVGMFFVTGGFWLIPLLIAKSRRDHPA